MASWVHRRWLLCLVGLTLVLGCSPSQRLTKAMSSSKALMAKGDEAMARRDVVQAYAQYDKANNVLASKKALLKSVPKGLAEAAQRIEDDLGLRLSARESPEGSARAALKFGGATETDAMMKVFWDPGAMMAKGLGEEAWNALSQPAREKLTEFSWQTLHSFVSGNRTIFANAVQEFLEERFCRRSNAIAGPTGLRSGQGEHRA